MLDIDFGIVLNYLSVFVSTSVFFWQFVNPKSGW
jgi:hypothetical protein